MAAQVVKKFCAIPTWHHIKTTHKNIILITVCETYMVNISSKNTVI